MKRFDFIAYVVLVLLIVALGWKVRLLSGENARLRGEAAVAPAGTSPEEAVSIRDLYWGKRVPAFRLPRLADEGEYAFDPEGRENAAHFLFVLFTPFDCYTCFREAPFWSEVANDLAEGLEVIAVATGTSAERIELFAGQEGIAIPLLYDEEGTLFAALDLQDSGLTPIRLLTNRSGLVLDASRSTQGNPQAEAVYYGYLEALTSPAPRSIP